VLYLLRSIEPEEEEGVEAAWDAELQRRTQADADRHRQDSARRGSNGPAA